MSATPAARRAVSWRGVEVGALAIVAVVMAWRVVPAHTTSIWMDREFTGWVAPVANRFADGLDLYTDGGHSPMAPLPFVLMRWLRPHGATWFDESLLNYVFQWLTLGCMYVGLSRRLPRPVPFLATLASVPVFLALSKSILYDSMSQFFVAVIALATDHHRSRLVGEPGARATRSLVVLGGVTALGVLSKQSTASGAALGACVVIALTAERPAEAARRVVQYGLAAAGWLVAIVVAMLHWLSPVGLVVDVFLGSTAPKGGGGRMVGNVLHYVGEYAPRVVGCLVVASLVARASAAARPEGGWVARVLTQDPSPRARTLAYATAGLGVLGVAAWPRWRDHLVEAFPRGADFLPSFPWSMTDGLLTAGFAIAIVCLVLAAQRETRSDPSDPLGAVAVYPMVLLPACVSHTLSVGSFRWTYDNNPMIVVAFAGVFVALAPLASRTLSGAVVAALGSLAAQFGAWTHVREQLDVAAACVESWPEVAFLRGARLRPSARGVRELVKAVRAAAPDVERDEVLLLPDDPNVEAWFERKRPHLTSAILFSDQYWDRFVPLDIERLGAHPPKVIVLAPKHFWPFFQSQWGPAAWNLIFGLEPLLTTQYSLERTVSIDYRDDRDDALVYVRKE